MALKRFDAVQQPATAIQAPQVDVKALQADLRRHVEGEVRSKTWGITCAIFASCSTNSITMPHSMAISARRVYTAASPLICIPTTASKPTGPLSMKHRISWRVITVRFRVSTAMVNPKPSFCPRCTAPSCYLQVRVSLPLLRGSSAAARRLCHGLNRPIRGHGECAEQDGRHLRAA
jgi:hypothetical protein